eukprot:gene1104-1202_t
MKIHSNRTSYLLLIFMILTIIQGWKVMVTTTYDSHHYYHYHSHYGHHPSTLSMSSTVGYRAREYRNLRPLPCIGEHKISTKERSPAFYLGPDRMIIQEKSPESCIARGLLPICIPEELETPLASAIQSSSDNRLNVYKSWSGQVITDRNGGLFDNLRNAMYLTNNTAARREIYEALRLKGSAASPYHGLLDAMPRFADLIIRGLLIEIADKPTAQSYSLGAAVLVARKDCKSRWRLTAQKFSSIKQATKGSSEACLVKCQMDELIGLAFASGLPIVIPTSVYDTSCIDGLLEADIRVSATTGESIKRMTISGPYFSTPQEARIWKTEQDRLQREAENSRRKMLATVPKAFEISDASTFLRLKTTEKRAILRATGLRELPRPREGSRAVDALLIPLLDEEVAYEVLRRLAETKGDFKLAAQMSDFESRKPQIAKQIREARQAGHLERAKELCDELNSLSMLRFDPTSPGGKSVEWDVEEWYWEQRKRVYGIIAA